MKGNELEEALEWMKRTGEIATCSPCRKDQCGAVLVLNGKMMGSGVNAPPQGFRCEERYCQPTCKEYAIHAEMNALIDALHKGYNVRGSRMYHARWENNSIANSRSPRCIDCAKHLFAFGVAEFVLKHAEGLMLYTTEEAYRLSLDTSNV